jgi:redox-sensitive bicupin YhaK (pirin superfamily)
MSVIRPVGIVMEPQETHEARDASIRRTIGSDKLVLLDPFLLLDEMSAPPTAAGEIGFPRHPHRGIETLTYLFAGGVLHKDSLGNVDSVGAGGAQWMTAGAGIFHEEYLQVGGDGHHGLQLWLNLPARLKRIPAQYRPAPAASVPQIALDGGATARIVAGTVAGVEGAFTGIATRPLLVDLHVPAGATVDLPVTAGDNAFVFVYRGQLEIGAPAVRVDSTRLAILGDGDRLQCANTGHDDAWAFVAAARPLGEPVLQYRSLVMNTVDEMKEALDDLERGTFV